jgi:hypothetical protein
VGVPVRVEPQDVVKAAVADTDPVHPAIGIEPPSERCSLVVACIVTVPVGRRVVGGQGPR